MHVSHLLDLYFLLWYAQNFHAREKRGKTWYVFLPKYENWFMYTDKLSSCIGKLNEAHNTLHHKLFF